MLQLPDAISPESKKNYNKRDELFNALLEMLKTEELLFCSPHVTE